MSIRVDVGFVPLSDAANLIVAKEMGFDRDEGIEIVLHREVSWSNIRDKVSLGIYPAAHMLSPMAIAMSLGLGPVSAGITVPMVLNQNGNTLTAGAQLSERLVPHQNIAELGLALTRAFDRPIRIGVPYPLSMHKELVRYWLRGCGVDVEKQVEFQVAPPPMLMDVLNAGEIDAFMVGEPWGSLAVETGARILLSGSQIWNAAPEKVLGVRRDWAAENPDIVDRLVRAIYRASLWTGDPANVNALAEILAMPHFVGVRSEVVARALAGHLVQDSAGTMMTSHDIMRLSGMGVNMPWKSKATWIANQAAAGWGVSRKVALEEADRVFSPDIFRRALTSINVNLPLGDVLEEGIKTGVTRVPGSQEDIAIEDNSFFDQHVSG